MTLNGEQNHWVLLVFSFLLRESQGLRERRRKEFGAVLWLWSDTATASFSSCDFTSEQFSSVKILQRCTETDALVTVQSKDQKAWIMKPFSCPGVGKRFPAIWRVWVASPLGGGRATNKPGISWPQQSSCTGSLQSLTKARGSGWWKTWGGKSRVTPNTNFPKVPLQARGRMFVFSGWCSTLILQVTIERLPHSGAQDRLGFCPWQNYYILGSVHPISRPHVLRQDGLVKRDRTAQWSWSSPFTPSRSGSQGGFSKVHSL